MTRLWEAPVVPPVSAGHGPRGRSRVDRTHMGWEGPGRTPLGAASCAPSRWGNHEPEGTWSPKSQPS